MNLTIQCSLRYRRCIGLFAFAACMFSQAVMAGPGTTDMTFGNGGIVVTQIVDDYDQPYAMAIANDGKIVVAGRCIPEAGGAVIGVARYLANGDLDTSFNGTGITTTPVGTQESFASAVVVQSDGKVVVTGPSRVSNLLIDIAVVRYNVDGSLDNTFGGDGKVTTSVGGSATADGIALQSDGKILVAGHSGSYPNYDIALVRYNTNGSLDTSFGGGDGIVTTDFSGSSYELARGVVLQSDGKIVVVGTYISSVGASPSRFAVARYHTNGSLDTSFSGDGKTTTAIGSIQDLASAAVVQSDGKIVVVGSSDVSGGSCAIVRYNTNGSLDATFNGTGIVTTPTYSGSDLALQDDGRIVVGSRSDFTVLRYLPDGLLDDEWGSAGVADADFGGYAVCNGIGIDAEGNIVAAGFTSVDGTVDFAVTRFVGQLWELDVSAEHGTVTGPGLYDFGTIATLVATPEPGYVFDNWTGDASGTDNPLEVLMNADKSIVANFVPDTTDSDGDGLSAYQEKIIYGTDPALSDSDGDGLSDGYEAGIGRFSLVTGGFTWGQAGAAAETAGGHLATFATQREWDTALIALGPNALDSITGAWIGATDADEEGTWVWITGEPFTFNVWAAGQPDDFNNSDVAEVSGGFGAMLGKWFDTGAGVFRDAYILETGYPTDPNVADADGDGLNDGEELAAGSNPFLADTDDDGLTDGQEVNLTHTNPLLKNTDEIGPDDGEEDPDEDDLTNLQEVNQYGTDPLIADTDEDGLKDGVEVNYAGHFFKTMLGSFTYAQAEADAVSQRGRVASFPNADDYSRAAFKARQSTTEYLWIGLSDSATEGVWLWTDGSASTYTRWLAGEPSGGATENRVVIMENSTQWADTVEAFAASGYLFERVGLDPLDPDTDADGLTDGQEVNTTLSDPTLDDTDGDGLLDGPEVNTHGSSPLLVDTDEDGLNDRVEVEVYGSNPTLKDTDSDGFDDGFEVSTGFDPTLATSTPEAYSEILIAVEFRFNAADGESYRIESSLDLINWEIVETDIAGAGDQITRFYTTEATPRRHFRARRN